MPPSTPVMYLWSASSALIGVAMAVLLAAALDQPFLPTITVIFVLLVALEILALKGVIPRWAYWEDNPAFLAINDERVVIARISPYRWSVRRVLVDESPRLGGFEYSNHHTLKRIGLAYVRSGFPPLYCQIGQTASDAFERDLTTRFGKPLRPDARA